jgi:UDP-N-acetylglucosamine 2-epimerase (non-hydrolysing)
VKIVTILGTRPEIIRLTCVIERLDRLATHVVVDTGQNFDDKLSGVFFRELGVRAPDHRLDVRGDSFGQQIAQILERVERVLLAERPDRVLLLGDTNSALSAFIAKRLGIAVFHMEAGNRCYDDRVPEEVNRRVIDHSSDVLMPYTERSRQNLLREGIAGERIFVTGNPILEVIRRFEQQIAASHALQTLEVGPRGYFLVTMHRAENVDVESRLRNFVAAFGELHRRHGLPVIVSTHPRTRARLEQFGVGGAAAAIRFLEPFGFADFIALERGAYCMLSDSGTVQEECCLFGTPNVTIRDVTERPETVECGSNILSGDAPDRILACVEAALDRRGSWTPPREYLETEVSATVAKILLGFHASKAR